MKGLFLFALLSLSSALEASGMAIDTFPSAESAAPAVAARPPDYIDWPTPKYFWTPAAYNLRTGEGNVFMTHVSYGVTDYFSAGAGLMPILLPGFFALPVWASAKFSLSDPDESLGALAVGGLWGTFIGHEKTGFGCVFGLGTLGSRDRNVTLGAMYGYFGDDWTPRPVLSLGGMLHVSDQWAIISDNAVAFGENSREYLLSVGGRYNGRKIIMDFGLMRPVTSEQLDVSLFPMFSLTFPFGNH